MAGIDAETKGKQLGKQRKPGNGRTPEENHEYAKLAANSQPRAMQLANAAAGRAARSAKLAAEIDPDGTMDSAELEREIKRRKDAQLAKARATRLTRIRRVQALAAEVDAEIAALERERVAAEIRDMVGGDVTDPQAG